ncbi:DUF1501 domain-containing protein [Jannaschia sp. Os4]|uniref:DUF1501 domain-containing protein n=1 Tax=Jannaschia sp. Os4 TaxID=2807617 RepID=UPI0019395CA8|nr:DUF1501 domain-containing protein [Jannaschia sp. Os4]MBM2575064.1 DUF1501 domain-containing protein [Jannaschia sp. Os4]
MDRRSFLAALGCSAAAFPAATPMAFASLPGDRRLVVVVLRGAMDGLDVLQPYADPGLRALRPTLSVGPEGGAHDLDGRFALHDFGADLLPLWRAGELAFAHAVATPYRDGRSHFDGQDVLEAGTVGVPPSVGRAGWLNRLLGAMPGATGRDAIAVGRDDMLILRGPAPAGAWAPESRIALDGATADLLRHVHHDDPLLRPVVEDALRLSADGGPEQGGGADRLFAFAAGQLRGDARIAALSLGGWDTHRGQGSALRRPMGQLSAGLLRLRDDLGPLWARTMVLAVTEFGRTASENGNRGTDHGTGGAMMLAGGALRGGRIWTDWPGLAEADLLDRRDLRPTRDVRAYAAWALRDLFGVDRSVLEGTVFPGLEMGEDPRLTL